MSASGDPLLRELLGLIEGRYLDPRRIDAQRMATGAAAALSHHWPGVAAWPRTIAVEPGDSLETALAPALELLLAGATSAGLPAAHARAVALDGAVRTLDRWCRVVDGQRRRRLLSRFSGLEGAIGIRLGRRSGGPHILECVIDGPAQRAGVRAGDRLIAVDGEPAGDSTIADLLRRVRGPVGHEVEMELERDPDRRISIRVGRAALESPVVAAQPAPGGALLLRIRALSKRAPAQVARALQSDGDPPPTGIVLDLRGNSGGSMLAAAAIADRFIDDGVLIEALDRHDQPVPGLRSRVDATERADLATPLAVLVDARTASSAELLAHVLSTAGRARVVGVRTFGKALVQQMIQRDAADLTLKLSVARMRGRGVPLPAHGLVPEILIPPSDLNRPTRWIRRALAAVRRR